MVSVSDPLEPYSSRRPPDRRNRHLLDLADGESVAEIGTGDGDLAFFLESMGRQVDIIDHATTNLNGMRGVRLLQAPSNRL